MKKILLSFLLAVVCGRFAWGAELDLGKLYLDLAPPPYGTAEVRWSGSLLLPPGLALIDNKPSFLLSWEIRNYSESQLPLEPTLEYFDFAHWQWVDTSIEKLSVMSSNSQRQSKTDLLGNWKYYDLRGFALTKYRVQVRPMIAGSELEAAREFYVSLVPPKLDKFPVFAENSPRWIAARYEKALLYKWLALIWRDISTSTYDERIVKELDLAIASIDPILGRGDIKEYLNERGFAALSAYFSPVYVNLSGDDKLVGWGGKLHKTFEKEGEIKSLLTEVKELLQRNSGPHLANAAKASAFAERKDLADRLDEVALAMRDEATEFSVLAYSPQNVDPGGWRSRLDAQYRGLTELMPEIVNAQERADLYFSNITQLKDVKSEEANAARLALVQFLSAIENLARADQYYLSLGYERLK
ncbi:hypothetical protein A3K48_02825 [candidate division WOR-1 bacterium RIFOXYA12_FULL_52_29]|uniref:Uncharacterized protein n=1 Tax=candidate division WOR-1 bacterium RIFOXYC12_FULL_54_18 TaxID=1802584 RepID=A0A1F4T535_UNCSA|nr:MAG: hypothetical protein A3K44_02825 [candidate division WOR-1 bacterium RIFOXYA2_FULL_51_19]OGC17504.1 MAG: hypothetical protein A3K48_02825 [candidate division WOR-1 bacterium RIFOXYA12_FULL_52_29]OGC26361.1 MAG: hypothetical protein A3K32_02820 [candidate division WOR-1 bacterium RIFOXYB2_FULL_45_9]OGC27921.1 MAG: hypothetical protein A3K49_02825 [candidate division WOR-1 bacterium RIFOXYC12_FULL_54_18]OGC29792.1 MAG: hypothetical protein A2346_03510 [candidate division WOR-1 bacterium R